MRGNASLRLDAMHGVALITYRAGADYIHAVGVIWRGEFLTERQKYCIMQAVAVRSKEI